MTETTTQPSNSPSKRRECLATVTSSGYIPATLVMIASFLEHNPWFHGDIAIIHDQLPAADRDLLSCFKNIKFLQVNETLMEKLETLNRDVPGCNIAHKYARFFSLEAFRLGGYEKVLFCDSDMLILDNLENLFTIPGDNPTDRLLCCGDRCYHFNGTRDAGTFNPLFSREEIDASKDAFKSTFNSGFMMIDGFYLDGVHYKNMLELLSKEIWAKVQAPLTDQVVLNRYFRDKFHLLSGKYNFILIFANQILKKEELQPDDLKVIHFAGKLKPWVPVNVFQQVITDISVIRYVRMWNRHYLEFLPHFHLQYQCMNRTLKNRKTIDS
jgi:lipopolysaccharide biosynthesis glycosyltransferase